MFSVCCTPILDTRQSASRKHPCLSAVGPPSPSGPSTITPSLIQLPKELAYLALGSLSTWSTSLSGHVTVFLSLWLWTQILEKLLYCSLQRHQFLPYFLYWGSNPWVIYTEQSYIPSPIYFLLCLLSCTSWPRIRDPHSSGSQIPRITVTCVFIDITWPIHFRHSSLTVYCKGQFRWTTSPQYHCLEPVSTLVFLLWGGSWRKDVSRGSG